MTEEKKLENIIGSNDHSISRQIDIGNGIMLPYSLRTFVDCPKIRVRTVSASNYNHLRLSYYSDR